jgi:hypothetical protein
MKDYLLFHHITNLAKINNATVHYTFMKSTVNIYSSIWHWK